MQDESAQKAREIQLLKHRVTEFESQITEISKANKVLVQEKFAAVGQVCISTINWLHPDDTLDDTLDH